MDKIPDSEFIKRNKKLQYKMEENDIDMLFIYGDDFHSANIRYLVDFWPAFENVLLLLPKNGEIIIAGSPETELHKKNAARIGKVFNVKEFIIEGEEAPDVETISLKEIILNSIKNPKESNFGLIGASYIPLGIYNILLKSIGKDRIKDYSNLLEGIDGLRVVKSENEIEMIKKAYRLAELGMNKAMDIIKDGIHEYEIAAEIEYIMRKNGAEGFAFDTMVASGDRSNTVVGRATEKIISTGDVIMVAVGSRYQGYTSSIGRPVYLGTPGKELKNFLNIGVNSAMISEEFLITGGLTSKVDTEARDYINKEGYGKYHLYSVGHGLGLNEVEEPFCTPNTNYNLSKGNIISIDIGLFGHPEFGGYRYEDGFYMSDNKGVALSSFKKITT